MNGHSNGYVNGHMHLDPHPKSHGEMPRSPYEHREAAFSSQHAYSYARSTATSDSGPEHSPPTGPLSEPGKPYSHWYDGPSPRDYNRGPRTPPYYPNHPHHLSGAPPLNSLQSTESTLQSITITHRVQLSLPNEVVPRQSLLSENNTNH
jgi:hypothetical protein